MSLANFRGGNGSDRSHLGLVVPTLASVDAAPSGPADLPRALDDLSEEAGFLQTLLDRAPSGLESFGSEDNEREPFTVGARVYPACDLEEETFPDSPGGLTIVPISRADLAGGLTQRSPGAPDDEPLPTAITPRTSAVGSILHGIARRIRATRSVVRATVRSTGRAVASPLRWAHARLDPRLAVVIALALVGVGEASWIGVRVAKEPGFTFFRTVEAVETADVVASPGVTGTSGSAIRVSVRTTPAATQSRNSKEPGWVAITAPSLVEILEDGRVIGASWNGGVRLAPGRHRLRILNRAKAIDLEQTLDIPAGSTTSLVVDPPPAGR